MDYQIESMNSFQLLGKAERQFVENVQANVFWDTCSKDGTLKELSKYSTSAKREYVGVADASSFNGESYLYYIATPYEKKFLPEGYTFLKIPSSTWIKFKCSSFDKEKDPWTAVYSDFFPLSAYEPANWQLEVYPCGDGNYPDEISEIWIAVRKKQTEGEFI